MSTQWEVSGRVSAPQALTHAAVQASTTKNAQVESSRAKDGCLKSSTYVEVVKVNANLDTKQSLIQANLESHGGSSDDWEMIILRDNEVQESGDSNDCNPYHQQLVDLNADDIPTKVSKKGSPVYPPL